MRSEQNRKLMKEYLIKGCKKEGTPLYFGVELEHFIVDKKTKETVSYYGDKGVEAILQIISAYYEEQEYIDKHLIALKRDDLTISLEPGAQLEVSFAKQLDVKAIKAIYERFLTEIIPVLEQFGYELITEGYQPKTKVEDISLIPKKRYQFMDQYFSKIGKYGRQMMRGTAATQISIDYYSEEDFKKKFWVAYHLEDQFTAFMEHTPCYEGEICNEKQLRSKIWRNTDAARVDLKKYMTENGISFDSYVEFVMNSPVIVDYFQGEYRYCEETVLALSEKRLFTETEIAHFFSMVFPMVRAKQLIEIRFADSNSIQKVLQYVELMQAVFSDIDKTMLQMKEGKWSYEKKFSRDGKILL